jgi:hypothetical protein
MAGRAASRSPLVRTLGRVRRPFEAGQLLEDPVPRHDIDVGAAFDQRDQVGIDVGIARQHRLARAHAPRVLAEDPLVPGAREREGQRQDQPGVALDDVGVVEDALAAAPEGGDGARLQQEETSALVEGPLDVLRGAAGLRLDGAVEIAELRQLRVVERRRVAQRGRHVVDVRAGPAGGVEDHARALLGHAGVAHAAAGEIHEVGVALDGTGDHALAQAERRGDHRLAVLAGLRVGREQHAGHARVDHALDDDCGADLAAVATQAAIDQRALREGRGQHVEHALEQRGLGDVQEGIHLPGEAVLGRVLAHHRRAHRDAAAVRKVRGAAGAQRGAIGLGQGQGAHRVAQVAAGGGDRRAIIGVELGQRGCHGLVQPSRQLAPHLGGHAMPGRHRQSSGAQLGQTRRLAAEQLRCAEAVVVRDEPGRLRRLERHRNVATLA